MRILMLTQFYPPIIGGEERHVVSLSEALVARGHEVAVATMPHPQRALFDMIKGVEVHSLHGLLQRSSKLFKENERPHAPPFPDPEFALRLNSLIEKFKPDIVHSHNWLLHSFLPLKLLTRLGLVSTLHDYSLVCVKKTLRRNDEHCDGPQIGKCMPCAKAHLGPMKGCVTAASHYVSHRFHRASADHFIAVSTAVAEKSGITDGNTPYTVLPTFIPDDLGVLDLIKDARLDLLPSEPFMLFVGELSGYKGVHVLIDAYKKLVNPPPLVLIGRRGVDTPQSLPPNVTLFESWPHAAVMHAWNRCLFGLAPSSWVEPCGTIVMEANVMGKPIVATNHGGLAELVEHGVNGLHVRPDDSVSLANAMQTLLDNPGLREKLGDQAMEYAERFKARSIVPKIETIYRNVIARRTQNIPERSSDVLQAKLDINS